MDIERDIDLIVVVAMASSMISIRDNRLANGFATIHVSKHHPDLIQQQESCLGTQQAIAGALVVVVVEEGVEGDNLLRCIGYRSSSQPPIADFRYIATTKCFTVAELDVCW